MNRTKMYVLIAIIFQFLLLTSMVFKAYYPIWVGEEVELKVIAKDPRDFLRGNYVELNYDFSSIDLSKIDNDLSPNVTYRYGHAFYLELKKVGEFHEVKKLCLSPSNSNSIYLKVINQNESSTNRQVTYGNPILSLKGGIEQYFTTKEKAKEIEKAVLESTINQNTLADTLNSEQNINKKLEDNFSVSVKVKIVKSGFWKGTGRISEIKYKFKK